MSIRGSVALPTLFLARRFPFSLVIKKVQGGSLDDRGAHSQQAEFVTSARLQPAATLHDAVAAISERAQLS
jgi:hypothetical protein